MQESFGHQSEEQQARNQDHDPASVVHYIDGRNSHTNNSYVSSHASDKKPLNNIEEQQLMEFIRQEEINL